MKISSLKYTFCAIIIGVAYYWLNNFFEWNFISQIEKFIQRQEHYEFLIPVFILLNGLLADLATNYLLYTRTKRIEEERLHTLKATMNNVNDLVNNFLNNLQYYHLRIEDKGTLTSEEQNQVRNLIWQTSNKLKQLEKVDRVIINKDTFRQIEITFPNIQTEPKHEK